MNTTASLPTSYAVGDHFLSPHGEIIVTRITAKYVFYETAGSKEVQDPFMPRHLFEEAILNGGLHGHRKETSIEMAKRLVDDYCIHEFQERADFTDLQYIGIAYSSIYEEESGTEYPVQVYLDLLNWRITRFIQDRLVETRSYKSLDDLIAVELSDLDFDSLVSFEDAQIKLALGHTIKS